MPSASQKQSLIDRLVLPRHLLCTVSISANLDRIRLAREQGVAVVDVDGSYLTQKLDKLKQSGLKIIPSPLEFPSPPLSGWEIVSADNFEDIATRMLRVTPVTSTFHLILCNSIIFFTVGILYTYLADSLRRPCAGSFRALTRGYLHWASGRVQKIEVNTRNPNYCHIHSSMVPSMKKGSYMYMVYVLLECEDGLAVVKTAACDCLHVLHVFS